MVPISRKPCAGARADTDHLVLNRVYDEVPALHAQVFLHEAPEPLSHFPTLLRELMHAGQIVDAKVFFDRNQHLLRPTIVLEVRHQGGEQAARTHASRQKGEGILLFHSDVAHVFTHMRIAEKQMEADWKACKVDTRVS